MQKNSLIQLETYLKEYQEHLNNRRGHELESYKNNTSNKIRRCITLAQDEFDITTFDEYTPSYLKRIHHTIQKTPWLGKRRSSNTIRNHIGALKSFYRFLKLFDYIAINPLAQYETPKKQTAKIRKIPDTERLLEKVGLIDISNPITHRNMVAISIMADLGCRAGVVRKLRITEIDLDEGTINVGYEGLTNVVKNGLKGFNGLMPISEFASAIIKDYLDNSHEKFCDGSLKRGAPESNKIPDYELMFPSVNGLLMSQNTFSEIITREFKKQSLSGITSHALRQHLVLIMARNGASIAQIMAVTGHKCASSVDNYLREDPIHIRKIQSLFNPFWHLQNQPKQGEIHETSN